MPKRDRHIQFDVPVLALALAGAVGCGNNIKGEIEDHLIKPKSTFFFTQDGAFGGDSLVGVVMTDVPNGCEAYTTFLTGGAAAPADLAARWAAIFPADFWDITFILRTGDPNVPLVGQAFQGIPWDAQLDAPQKVQGWFTHNLALHDQAYFDGTGNPDVYRRDYVSNGGTMEISKHEPGAAIAGRFATFTVDPDNGSPTGLLEITFSGDFCPTADLLDNVGAGAGG